MIFKTRFNLSISKSIDRGSNTRSINDLWNSSSKCLASITYKHPFVGLTPAQLSATSELPPLKYKSGSYRLTQIIIL